jgi:hypothetical protein
LFIDDLIFVDSITTLSGIDVNEPFETRGCLAEGKGSGKGLIVGVMLLLGAKAFDAAER